MRLSVRLRRQPCLRSRSRSTTTGVQRPPSCSLPASSPLFFPLVCVCVCVHLTPCPVLNLGIHLFLSLCVWLRTKRTLGLGSLYGENDLLELDGDPLHERQVAEKQLAALGDIL